MAEDAARIRADAIEGFAATLRDLRQSVGDPSFREMSGRSRAISHTTLHEASKGYRLPSWATTVEFVKACRGEPAEYRERWDHASRTIASASRTAPPDEPITELPAAEPPHHPHDITPQPGRHRTRRALQVVAAAAGVAAVVIGVAEATDSDGKSRTGSGPGPTAQAIAAGCPVRQSNPPTAVPAHPGDESAFITDITLPDCSHIVHGTTVTKIWRFKNAGTVAWTGYTLHRIDLPQQRSQCQTIADIPVTDTPPGGLVDIRTEITAPDKPGFCFVRFKMVDAAGHLAFPGSRPVNFQLYVD